ncbi:MAG: ComEA family DNA-binding protein, partial [Ginsengibacter sp.]
TIGDEPPEMIEQQLEDITASNEDAETEDDAYLQQMQHFLKEPLNLNYADAGLLEQLNLLSPLQISNLLSYRKLLGNFLNIYELQAIPGWDLQLIRQMRPYITVQQKTSVTESFKKRLKNGDHTILLRMTETLQKSKGFLLDSSTAKNYYPGNGQKLLLRHKYKSGNHLQYGFTAEKDAGEQFFKGAQKYGFDFYSAHFFLRNSGMIKSLALGDFSVNLGQGLIQWQSLAFGKGGEMMNVKRQSDVLRPYNSTGEIVFNRGAGITLQKKNWETTGFISYRKTDASINEEGEVTALQSSGYHRTTNEIAGKGSEGQLSFGGNVSYSSEKFHLGANLVNYILEHPISKPDYWYNKYALSGKRVSNYSLDYSYTYKNMHFFGEAAMDKDAHKAFINGLLINTDSRAAMSFLCRNISKGYQSLYGNAFTENTYPTNESGFYSAITLNPSDFLRIDAYADFYHFPWLKYRTDAPSSGNDYMVQLIYKPNKQAELSSRFRYQNKPINYNPDDLFLNPVVGRPKQSLRTQFNYKIDSRFTFRSRFELSWFDKRGAQPQKGFLTFGDIIYKPLLKPFSGNLRLSYFETDGYDSRIYAFENDVLYGYSIPAFFDKGYHYYVNLHYKFSRKLSCWARFSQTVYSDISEIGSGLDVINGNKKSQIRLQVLYDF